MPDVFQDGCPGSDADTSANEDGNLVLKDVFGWCTIRTVDADMGKILTFLKSNFIFLLRVVIRVQRFKFLCLSISTAESIAEALGPVTELADVNADVRVVWA